MKTYLTVLVLGLLGCFLFFTNQYEVNQLTGYLRIEGCDRFKEPLPRQFSGYKRKILPNTGPIIAEHYSYSSTNGLLISGQALIDLPKAYFKNIDCVDGLILSNNTLDNIPTAIKDLKQLKELKLDKNFIKNIPIVFFENNPNLERVTLSENSFTQLPLPYFSDLKFYDLSNNIIKDVFKDEVSENTQIEHINLAHNSLIKIPLALAAVQNLKDINLSNNKIAELYSLNDYDILFEDLNTLNLSNNSLRVLPLGMSKAPQLEYLDLKNNRLVGQVHLKDYYRLKEINLNNQIISSITLEGTYNLNKVSANVNEIRNLELLNTFEKLTHLDFHKNEFYDIPNLTNAPNLEYLNLSMNKLKDEIEWKNIGHIKKVNLSYNELPSIKNQLNTKAKIEDLDLSNNQITTLNFNYFPISLQELNITANQISEIRGTKMLPNLSLLKINNNPEAKITISFLKKMPNLTLLEMDDTFMDDEKTLRKLEKYCYDNNIELILFPLYND
jgi:Leucine-rich repeat (LRR) protein